MIPLVPVDQLPAFVELEGIPRQLLQHQMIDEDWKVTCVTDHPTTTLQTKHTSPGNSDRQLPPIQVRLPPTREASAPYLAPDHIVRSEAGKDLDISRQAGQYTDRPTTVAPYSEQSCTSRTATLEHPRSSADTPPTTYIKNSLRFGHCSPNPSGVVPDHSKKVYCTHWMRTGSCDFTQIGCKFKHEMPPKAKLLELGIRQTPLWWKEKQAIRTSTWMDERRAAINTSGNELPPPRVHDRLSWIDRLSIKRDTHDKDDRLVSTPKERPATNEPANLGSTFVDDLIDLHDDTDDSSSSDTATSANSSDTEASSTAPPVNLQSLSTPRDITGHAAGSNSSPGCALQGDFRNIPDPELMVTGKPSRGHDNDTNPTESGCNSTGTASEPTRPYYKPQKHNGLAASQHANVGMESPQSPEAHHRAAESSADQPAGKESQAVVKRSRPYRRQVRPKTKSSKQDEVCVSSK